MNNLATIEQTSAQDLFFLYELGKVFSSSIDLNEVAEYILDGACALIGTEKGFLCVLDPAVMSEGQPVLRPYVLRGLSLSDLQALAPRLQPVWDQRQVVRLSQNEAQGGVWKDLLAAPLIVRDQVYGILSVLTATTRPFTAHEQERLASVTNLGALALENSRLYDQIQQEVQTLRRLIDAARQMGNGQLSADQIKELEDSLGRDELSRFSQAFGQMARQVIDREEALHKKVRELEIVIDEAKRDRQIAEITESDYFQTIQQKVQGLKRRRDKV